MIRHLVFFKFKPAVPAEQRNAAVNRLRALPAKIPVIGEYQIGEDVLRSPRSWDVALVSVFESLETLQQYQVHADHVAAARELHELCESMASVDFPF